mgnify:CR=1 FL=1
MAPGLGSFSSNSMTGITFGNGPGTKRLHWELVNNDHPNSIWTEMNTIEFPQDSFKILFASKPPADKKTGSIMKKEIRESFVSGKRIAVIEIPLKKLKMTPYEIRNMLLICDFNVITLDIINVSFEIVFIILFCILIS